MRNEEFRAQVKSWLAENNVSRKELAEESGYVEQSIHDMLSKRPISNRAKKAILDAMARIEKRSKNELGSLSLDLSDETVSILRAAAERLNMTFDDFIDVIVTGRAARRGE